MADIYIIKERIKLLLALVGVAFVIAGVVALKAYTDAIPQQENPHLTFCVVVTSALAVAWLALLLLYIFTRNMVLSSVSLIDRLDRIPWGVMGSVILVVLVLGLGIAVFFYSHVFVSPFQLLRDGQLEKLEGKIKGKPSLLELREKKGNQTLLEVAWSEGLTGAVELLLAHEVHRSRTLKC
jgi:formate/nitrite transporter FocA (FNT family)